MIRLIIPFMLLGTALPLCAQGPLRLDAIPATERHPTLTRSQLPAPWEYQKLGLFCKLDIQLERRSPIPVVIRLGDVRAVDRWEGKGPILLP